MNVDLAKDAFTRVNESVRRIRGNYGDAAGLNFTFFIADRNSGRTLDDKRDFDIRMLMQRGTLPGFGGNDVSGKRRTLPFADKLVRHSNKRQLLEIEKTHAFGVNIFGENFRQLKWRFVGHARAYGWVY